MGAGDHHGRPRRCTGCCSGGPAAGTRPGRERYRVPADAAALAALRELGRQPDRGRGGRAGAARRRRAPPADAAAALSCGREFARALDTAWRRTSYSALTAAAHDAGRASAASRRTPGNDDEARRRAGRRAAEPPTGAPAALPSPMAELPGGAGFGTLVHAVLEAADLDRAPTCSASSPRTAASSCARHPVPGVDADALAAALLPVAAHPARAAGRRPARWPTSPPRDRLRRAGLRAAAGRRRRRRGPPVDPRRRWSPLLRRHLPADDPLRALPRRCCAELAEQPLRGYLTGSIDAVLRLPGPAVRRRRLQDQLARPDRAGRPSR